MALKSPYKVGIFAILLVTRPPKVYLGYLEFADTFISFGHFGRSISYLSSAKINPIAVMNDVLSRLK